MYSNWLLIVFAEFPQPQQQKQWAQPKVQNLQLRAPQMTTITTMMMTIPKRSLLHQKPHNKVKKLLPPLIVLT